MHSLLSKRPLQSTGRQQRHASAYCCCIHAFYFYMSNPRLSTGSSAVPDVRNSLASVQMKRPSDFPLACLEHQQRPCASEHEINESAYRLTHTPTRDRFCVYNRIVSHGRLQRDDLPFPRSLPEFQQLFPDEAKCAAYMEKARWGDGFVVRIAMPQAIPSASPLVPVSCAVASAATIRGLSVGTVMERSLPLSTWFWAAFGRQPDARHLGGSVSATAFGLSRYETAFGILHKLRAGMVRPNQDYRRLAGGTC